MKILKEGKLPGSQLMRATCRSCGCQFEFERREANVVSDPRESCLAIKCPQKGCGHEVYLNA